MEFIASSLFMVGIFVMLAVSFNLIIGFAGLMSIAHPIFFALGAYGSGLLVREFGLPIPISLVGGMAIAGVASIALSLPSLRVSGDYLVIASIGFQLGLLQIIKNVEFTGGPGGFSNIAPLFATHGPGALLGAAAIAWACGSSAAPTGARSRRCAMMRRPSPVLDGRPYKSRLLCSRSHVRSPDWPGDSTPITTNSLHRSSSTSLPRRRS
jgi:branched-subunit amino acid ABC-type transport system permease component